MCDTLCIVGRDRTLFGKNSDRPPNEAQVLEWHARSADGSCNAVLGSRPTWMQGFEHGVNEHGVAIGNEKIFTTHKPELDPAQLIGMDLVRLGLERARDADAALDVITASLEAHGQSAQGELDPPEAYYSSFLVTDAHGAWIIETNDRAWVAKPVSVGDAAAISNRISLRDDWVRSSAGVAPGTDIDTWRHPRVPTEIADHRLAATRRAIATRNAGAADLATALRDHGAHGPLPPADVYDDFSGVSVCMHVRDYQATTASMIAELRADRDAPRRVWACLGSPCVGVYVPIFLPAAPSEMADPAQWARFARLRDRVDADASALAEVRAILDPVEHELWAEADTLAAGADAEKFAAFAARAWHPVDAGLTRLAV